MIDRREFLQTGIAGATGFVLSERLGAMQSSAAADDRAAVVAAIKPRHEATVRMLREWIALPSIAAEDLN